jgi:hypothetical protein
LFKLTNPVDGVRTLYKDGKEIALYVRGERGTTKEYVIRRCFNMAEFSGLLRHNFDRLSVWSVAERWAH